MVRKEDVDLLRKRALSMLRASKYHFKEGDYDLAAFLAEQAVQLYLKYKIFDLTGEIPRTHIIRQLFGVLAQLLANKRNIIQKFIKENRSLIIRLEEAYTSSRYLLRKYEKDETKELVDFAEKVIKFVQDL
ncbi:MAG: DNA-binding protein [Thermoprotei archaeon]|nr:MAG: DNA-binding protein [Thermoprotei archaeon]